MHASQPPMPKRPQSDAAGSTLIDGDDAAHGAEDEAPGATAFVRVDRTAPAPLPPPRRSDAAPVAPRKGLQVSLPDDEPAPVAAPKPAAPLPEEKKGRRGAWWDEKSEPIPEPAPDDLPGRTAVFQPPEPVPIPEPEPVPEPEPEVEPYRPVPAEDYQGHVPPGPPRWKARLRRAAIAAAVLAAAGI